MADGKAEVVSPEEFAEVMAKASEDEANRQARSRPIEPPSRRLFFNEKTPNPGRRRVKCIVAHINGRAFDCPVLMSKPIDGERSRCILLVVEEPRIITTVAIVPKVELERAPETDIDW